MVTEIHVQVIGCNGYISISYIIIITVNFDINNGFTNGETLFMCPLCSALRWKHGRTRPRSPRRQSSGAGWRSSRLRRNPLNLRICEELMGCSKEFRRVMIGFNEGLYVCV